jgi:DNA-binding NarL/FixJ family response regulator
MNIVIVDDHQLIREGLKKVLMKESDIKILGEAGNYSELLEQISGKDVDIIVLDLSLPGRSGLDIISDLRSQNIKMKILVLSMHPEERFAIRVLKAGANGYLTKESAAEQLVNALRKIYSGGKFISPKLAEHLASEITSDQKPLHELLSNREFEILRLISFGKTVSQIAVELSLSINTITSYRTRVLEKMNMKTNAELIRYALKHQLVD